MTSFGDGLGTNQRARRPCRSRPGRTPRSARAPRPASGGDDTANFLHYNPYPNTASPGQERECEAGNEVYTPGQVAIGNVPGNQGTATKRPDPGADDQGQKRRRGRSDGEPATAPGQGLRRADLPQGQPAAPDRNALILIALLIAGTYLAWTKSLPFTPEYELHAVFQNSANIRKDSPVRIAGVNVGKVTSTRSVGDVSEVTFTVDDSGQPIHDDAQVEIRPRIFLEGNFFLDVKSGSPSAPALPDGGTIPITQTSTAVQLDQILTSLQAPDRENLQKLLAGYGTALNHRPTAAEDRTQDPDVQGETAAESINDSFDVRGDCGA